MKKINLVVSVIVIIIINSCGEGITEPQPGRRDYVWSVDTLNMPMNFISAIWGSSPQDVWVVGAGGSSTDRLLHYNGEKWEAYTKEQIYCTGETLFGFSRNNIWMGGGDGSIWHYDGEKWSENFRYVVEGAWDVTIYDIWGTQPNDIYACGNIVLNTRNEWKGFILHYNGYKWKEVFIDTVGVKYNTEFLKIKQEKSKVYVYSYKLNRSNDGNNIIAFYELKENSIKEIYSNNIQNITWAMFNLIGNNLYFLLGRDLFLYRNEQFIKQFSIENPNFWYYLFGRNEKDIFISMRDGLAHYNGSSIQYILKYPSTYYKIIGGAPAIFEKELFIGLFDMENSKNLILYGRLKN